MARFGRFCDETKGRKRRKACALRRTKNENEGRLAQYERTKTKKACALRKDEQGLRITKERKDENKNGLRITKDENENTKAVGWKGGRGEMVSERRIFYSNAKNAKNAKFYLSTTFVSDG